MANAQSVIDVVLGEAGGKTREQRLNDMKHIFSSMVNRAKMTGQSIEDIALNRSQYNAYGKRLPAGVEQYRDLAQQALDEVMQNGPVTDATFYATKAATGNLPGRLAPETETVNGHQYFSDPELRGLITNNGVKQPGLLNTPTPEFASREQWTSAVPGEVERGLLADLPSNVRSPSVSPQEGYGLLASTMSQTPSLNLSGAGIQSAAANRMAGGEVANGMDQLRSGLLSSGSIPSREAELADMQAQANFQNEVNQSRQRVTQPSVSAAFQAEQPQVNGGVAAIEAASPTQSAQATPQGLANAYSQLGQSMEQGGILGLSGQKIMDPNDVLGVGKLQQQPSLAVESMPAIDTTQVSDIPAIEGPATGEVVTTPQRTNRTSVGGLLSPAEYQAVSDQQMALSEMGVNKSVQLKSGLKKGLGTFGGGILGAMLGGPLGALAGGLLGPALMNGLSLGPKTGARHFPSAPKDTPYGNGKETAYGRSVRESSGQYDRAAREGSHGLY